MNAPELGVEEWAFKVHAETASAVGPILLQLVCRLDDLRRGVEHRLPWSGHDARHETGRAGLRVRGAGNCDGVTLISIEEICPGAVRMHVDQARSDRAARRERIVGRAVGCKNAHDPAVFDCQTPERRRSIADRNKGGPKKAFGHYAQVRRINPSASSRCSAKPLADACSLGAIARADGDGVTRQKSPPAQGGEAPANRVWLYLHRVQTDKMAATS